MQSDRNPVELRAPRGERKSWREEPAGSQVLDYGEYGFGLDKEPMG